MRAMRWLTIGALVTNLVLMALTGTQLRDATKLRNRLNDQLQTMREAQQARPPHPCGQVIMPGESCSQTMMLVIPTAKEPTY